jgi:hypothetical protein
VPRTGSFASSRTCGITQPRASSPQGGGCGSSLAAGAAVRDRTGPLTSCLLTAPIPRTRGTVVRDRTGPLTSCLLTAPIPRTRGTVVRDRTGPLASCLRTRWFCVAPQTRQLLRRASDGEFRVFSDVWRHPATGQFTPGGGRGSSLAAGAVVRDRTGPLASCLRTRWFCVAPQTRQLLRRASDGEFRVFSDVWRHPATGQFTPGGGRGSSLAAGAVVRDRTGPLTSCLRTATFPPRTGPTARRATLPTVAGLITDCFARWFGRGLTRAGPAHQLPPSAGLRSRWPVPNGGDPARASPNLNSTCRREENVRF